MLLLLAIFNFLFVSPTDHNQHRGDESLHQSLQHTTPPQTTTKEAAKSETAVTVAQQIADLQSQFTNAKATLLSKLRRDYGTEALQAMFFFDPNHNTTTSITNNKDTPPATSLGRYLFRSGNSNSTRSWGRARRKLVAKLCRVLLLDQPVSFVWATGGPSTAAGHGNFWAESYTAVLERAVQDVFTSVGLQFTARNCGMSNVPSAIEIALCAPQIFGTDVDLVVYDYALTDGSRQTWMQKLFQHRVGLFCPNRPIQLALHCAGKTFQTKAQTVQELEELGLSALIEDEDLHRAVMAAVPDSFGKSEAELNAMPLLIRNFRCRDQMERGDPYCARDKFNTTDCPDRQYRTSWHPGWKYHAVMGNLLALFLVELLEDAIKELSAEQHARNDKELDPTILLRSLQAAEDAEYEIFLGNASIDNDVLTNAIDLRDPQRDDFDFTSLVTSPTFCHTARRPAEIRFQGILTERTEPFNATHFERGTSLIDALGITASFNAAPTGTSLRLVYDDNEEESSPCPILTNVDRRDYFFVSGADEEWKTLIVPNDTEMEAYGSTGSSSPLKGYVAVCFAPCRREICPDGALKWDDFLDGKFEFSVNGVVVDALTSFPRCWLLKSHTTGWVWPANAQGRFEFGARVTGRNTSATNFLRLGAILVW